MISLFEAEKKGRRLIRGVVRMGEGRGEAESIEVVEQRIRLGF